MMRLRSKELSCPSWHDEIYGAYKTIIYMNEIIGRKKEISELKRLYASRTAEFVAIYGRRRVGKTFFLWMRHSAGKSLSAMLASAQWMKKAKPIISRNNSSISTNLYNFKVCAKATAQRTGSKPFLCWRCTCSRVCCQHPTWRTVSKVYHKTLVHRSNLLLEHLSPKMAIHPILITTYGLTHNEYSREFINCVTFNELFES